MPLYKKCNPITNEMHPNQLITFEQLQEYLRSNLRDLDSLTEEQVKQCIEDAIKGMEDSSPNPQEVNSIVNEIINNFNFVNENKVKECIDLALEEFVEEGDNNGPLPIQTEDGLFVVSTSQGLIEALDYEGDKKITLEKGVYDLSEYRGTQTYGSFILQGCGCRSTKIIGPSSDNGNFFLHVTGDYDEVCIDGVGFQSWSHVIRTNGQDHERIRFTNNCVTDYRVAVGANGGGAGLDVISGVKYLNISDNEFYQGRFNTIRILIQPDAKLKHINISDNIIDGVFSTNEVGAISILGPNRTLPDECSSIKIHGNSVFNIEKITDGGGIVNGIICASTRNAIISNNTVHNVVNSQSPNISSAIYIQEAVDSLIEGNTVSKSDLGLQFKRNVNASITDNTASETNIAAISVSSNNRNITIHGNTIVDNGWRALVIVDTINASVSNNIVRDSYLRAESDPADQPSSFRASSYIYNCSHVHFTDNVINESSSLVEPLRVVFNNGFQAENIRIDDNTIYNPNFATPVTLTTLDTATLGILSVRCNTFATQTAVVSSGTEPVVVQIKDNLYPNGLANGQNFTNVV